MVLIFISKGTTPMMTFVVSRRPYAIHIPTRKNRVFIGKTKL
jgi:hypothetical protein